MRLTVPSSELPFGFFIESSRPHGTHSFLIDYRPSEAYPRVQHVGGFARGPWVVTRKPADIASRAVRRRWHLNRARFSSRVTFGANANRTQLGVQHG